MKNNKRIYLLLLFNIFASGFLYAQSASGGGNGVLSAYSRYGFGQLSDNQIGRQSAMGGVALGMRDGAQVNVANPASYSKCDSLTFLFDVGISLYNGNFDNGSQKMNVKNASFDYLAMQFRAFKNIGVSFGFLPYSKIGYDYATTHKNITDKYSDVTPYSTFTGYGGITSGYLGVGAKILGGLSVGANISYMFGDMTHTINNKFVDPKVETPSIYSYLRTYNASINTYKIDLGLQYEQALSKHDKIVLGATYSLGHTVNNDAVRTDYTYDEAKTQVEQSTETTIHKAFELPNTIGVGLSYTRDTKLTLGVDYIMQKWGEVKYPMTTSNGFESVQGILSDRNKITAGLEYTPNNLSRNYLKRVHYRLGGYSSTSYTKIKGNDGGKEFGLSFGFGLPIQNAWNNRSQVNITGQWIHVSSGTNKFITENYLKICIGLTFDERMFMKWKVN